MFYRDTIIRSGGLVNLVEVVDRTIKSAIPVLCRAIAQSRVSDREILADCCWAISYHSDANKNKIQVVVDSKVIPRIIKNLEESTMPLLVPSIRILGNISTGTAEHTN